VEKKGETLRIGIDWWRVWSVGSLDSRALEARITMPDLVSLKMSGATNGTVRGFKSDGDLGTAVSGASKLDLDVETGRFTSEISGSSEVSAKVKSTGSDIEVSGASSVSLEMDTGGFVYESSGASDGSGSVKAASTIIHLTGSSDLHLTGSGGDLKLTGSGASEAALRGFSIEDADIILSGATDADVDISGTLNITLSGASELTYGGNPRLGDRMDITGGSRFERR
jgi:hypothetical protein